MNQKHIIITTVLLLLICSGSASAWLSGYDYRQAITSSSLTPEANFQLKVELNASNFNYQHANSDGSDIRFTETDDAELDYWLESWNCSSYSFQFVGEDKIFEKPNSDGLTTDGTYLYESVDAVLSKYNWDGTLVDSTTNARCGYDLNFGGLFYKDGFIYGAICKYVEGFYYTTMVVKILPSDLSCVESWNVSTNLTYAASAIFYLDGYWFLGESGAPTNVNKNFVRFDNNWNKIDVALSVPFSNNYGFQGATVKDNIAYVTDHEGEYMMSLGWENSALVEKGVWSGDGHNYGQGITHNETHFHIYDWSSPTTPNGIIETTLQIDDIINTSIIWTEVATTNTEMIYMYYGNSSAGANSNGPDTFLQWHGAASVDFSSSFVVAMNNITFEANVSVVDSPHAVLWGLCNTVDFDDDYMGVYSRTDVNLRKNQVKNAGVSSVSEEPPNLFPSTWYKLKQTHNGSYVRGYVDNNEVGDGVSTNIPDGIGGLYMYSPTGACEQEWSFVRKYTSPEPTTSIGIEEHPFNDIILAANQHGMLRKNVIAAETFSTIAAGIDHDRCYTWWDSTTDRWESYRVGYSYNAGKSVPEHDSYFVLMDGTGTTISCSAASAETVAIPSGYYATYLRESTNKTLSAIKTDMGGNVDDLWAFDPTTGAWTSTGTYSVLPNQGLMVNSSTGFNWDGAVP